MTWTVVYRKGRTAPSFVPTDVHFDTWSQARDHAMALPREWADAYVVRSTDKDVHTGRRRVRIDPTAAQRQEAMARANRVAVLRSQAERDQLADRLFRAAASRVGVADHRALTNAELAAVYVDAGWDWSTITRAMS